MPLREHHRQFAASMAHTNIDRSGADRPGADQAELGGGEPEYIHWGPDDSAVETTVLATVGSVELEYAAIRRGVGLIDASQRGVVQLRGADRLDLLGRLLTQELKHLGPGHVASAFLLQRTGRIIADLLVVAEDDKILLDCDRCDVSQVAAAVEAMIFVEDVQVQIAPDCSVVEVHGPGLGALLKSAGGSLPQIGESNCIELGEARCVIARLDTTSETGVRIYVPTGLLPDVWQQLHDSGGEACEACRTVGWFAFNMARVEAGTPWWNVDFGSTSLPHETGVLDSRVSFTKGCYPGQEVVARMQNLGHPKQVVRMLSMPDTRLPIAGGQVFAGNESSPGDPIGAVTSSAPAPLRGGSTVAFATIRWASASPGTLVSVVADGELVPVEVCELMSEELQS